MGRAVLAHVPDGEREALLAAVTLAPLTPRTITDKGVLRAELAAVREQGWALVDQELEEGLRSVAAPLRDGTGRVVAAVNVSAPVRRGPVEQMATEILPALLRAAREIEADLARTRT
jgi:IclR family pca regulon transcriptional regulator